MRTLNYVVLVLVLVSFGFVSFGCGESDSPTAPSVMQDAPSVRSTAAPSTPVLRATPVSFDADNVRPDQDPTRAESDNNAYDFYARYDGAAGMLKLALVERDMPRMRTASQPHRNRMITVHACQTSEPRHVLQTCGDPIWQGSMMLSGRLELPDIPLASCDGWIVVQAAELSDDKYDGWRNAPCPAADGTATTGSDGSGGGWTEYPDWPRPEPQPEAEPTPTPTPMPDPTPAPAPAPGHAQRVVDREIEADPLRQRGDYVQFPVRNLFQNPVGTNSYHFPVRSSDESVATARIVTDNPEIRITVTGFGTTTISVRDTRADVSVSFVVSVMPEPTPTPTPMPTPEPTPNPILPGTLPVSFTDPTGDLVWVGSSGSRPSTDLIGLTLSAQDPDGWIRVTFSLAGHYDEAAIQSALGGFSSNGSIIRFFLSPREGTRTYFGLESPDGYISENRWVRGYLGLGAGELDWDDDGGGLIDNRIRSVPGRTGTTFSYEINPQRALRGIPIRTNVLGRFTSRVLLDDDTVREISSTDEINGEPGNVIVIPYGVTVPFGCDAISPDRCFFSILREGRERQYFTMESGDRRNVEHVMPGVDSYAVIVMGPVRRADTIPGTRPPGGWEDDLCTTEEERTTPVGVDWCKRATINARYNN